ncbi:MAG: hypothetical protein ACK5Q5_21915 [Planctomycetaceae bacterium]
MTTSPSPSGSNSQPLKRYRLPGIEREGLAQLSLLETALWPLKGGRLERPQFETTYAFTTEAGRQTATVTVRSALGLQPIDEYVLYGLLGATLARSDPEATLLATPYWMLRHLGLTTGGSQYAELRDSLLRIAVTSYQNTGFYNPESQEHEFVAFQFLSILLPTIGGVGETVDNDRCWRIEWNPAFFRFCQATGGNLLFDLDLYRELTPAARRLFLKLKDRFWRSNRVFLNVDDLTVNGLGFSAARPLRKRKYDLTQCLRELLSRGIIELGRGQTDVKDLFLKRGKGSYVVVLYSGEYFRQPLTERAQGRKNAVTDDPLYEPLQKIGLDAAAIRRLFQNHSRGTLQRWLRITDAAMHEQPRGFPGFKVSPAAFFVDGVKHNRMPPDWLYAHEKRREQEQHDRTRARSAASEAQLQTRYTAERQVALQQFLDSTEGKQAYRRAFDGLLPLYQVREPHRVREATHEAAMTRVAQFDWKFPSFEVWVLGQPQSTASTAI